MVSSDIDSAVSELLQRYRGGMSARELTQQLRILGWHDLRKSDVNSALYRGRSAYHRIEGSPPIWVSAASQETGQAPDQEPKELAQSADPVSAAAVVKVDAAPHDGIHGDGYFRPLLKPACVDSDEFDCTGCNFYETCSCCRVSANNIVNAREIPGYLSVAIEQVDRTSHRFAPPKIVNVANESRADLHAAAVAELEAHGLGLHYEVIARMIAQRYPALLSTPLRVLRSLRHSESVMEIERGVFCAKRRTTSQDVGRAALREEFGTAREPALSEPGSIYEMYRAECMRYPLLSALDEKRLSQAIEVGVVAGWWRTNASKQAAAMQHVSQALGRAHPRTCGCADPDRCTAAAKIIHDEAAGEDAVNRRLDAFDRWPEAVQLSAIILFLPFRLHDMETLIHEAGDATRRFAEANLRLVTSRAYKFSSREEFLDLIQEGSLGLMRAVERWDWRRNFRFATLAIPWIDQAIRRYIANFSRTIRLPIHVWESMAPGEVLPVHLQPAISYDQLARRLPSIETLMIDGTQDAPDENALFSEEVAEVLATLTSRERVVIELRFGLVDNIARTLDEVGAQFGVTRERARQIEAKALRKLRHPSRLTKLATTSGKAHEDAEVEAQADGLDYDD